MKITIAGIGKIKENWMRDGIREYVTRLAPIAKVQICEQDEEKMPVNPSEAIKEKVMEKEGEKILRYIQPDDFVILLDTAGKELSSPDLSKLLEKQMVLGKSSFTFLIGGPFGNGNNLKDRADFRLCIGRMTFTHQMARLILVEQIYRAMKIMRNEPYHL